MTIAWDYIMPEHELLKYDTSATADVVLHVMATELLS